MAEKKPLKALDIQDIIDESLEHAKRHDYNIDSWDIAATSVFESAQRLNIVLDEHDSDQMVASLLQYIEDQN